MHHNVHCSTIFFPALFTIAKTWKQPESPSKEVWIKKMQFIYTIEYYLLPLSETYICLGDTASPFKRICFSLHFKIIAMKEHRYSPAKDQKKQQNQSLVYLLQGRQNAIGNSEMSQQENIMMELLKDWGFDHIILQRNREVHFALDSVIFVSSSLSRKQLGWKELKL